MNVRLLIGIALSALTLAALPARAEPRRIVSLNPCLDAILVEVADREQIAALSHFARDRDTSTIADIATDFPLTYESAEEVMSFKPDLVLTSRHSSLATRNALRRVEIATELFIEPQSIAESLAQVRAVAAAVNRPARGEYLVAQIEAALQDAAPEPNVAPLQALLYQRNGFSTGGGTMLDDLLTHAGFQNVGSRYGLKGWGNIPMERVIADPPAVLLATQSRPGMPTWANRIAGHPALRHMQDRMYLAAFPDKFIYCGGPVLIKATQALRDVRLKALESQTHKIGAR